MTDIRISASNADSDNLYNDIEIINGIVSLTSNTVEEVRQKVLIRLSTFRGEWFLDSTVGLPYFQQMLARGATQNLIDGIIRTTISETDGVESLISFTSEIDRKTREYSTQFVVSVLEDGDLTNITISI